MVLNARQTLVTQVNVMMAYVLIFVVLIQNIHSGHNI